MAYRAWGGGDAGAIGYLEIESLAQSLVLSGTIGRMGGDRDAWLRQPTRHRILLAAETCFAADGFDGSRIDEIARLAAVSKSHLYYHFASKDELLSCLVELRTTDLLGAKDTLLAQVDVGTRIGSMDARQQVLERAITDVLVPQRAFIRIALVEVIRNPAAAAPFFEALDTMLEDSVTRLSNSEAGAVSDVASTKALLFYFAILPSLFRVAVDDDPVGLPGESAALAAHLAQVEQALLAVVWASDTKGAS